LIVGLVAAFQVLGGAKYLHETEGLLARSSLLLGRSGRGLGRRGLSSLDSGVSKPGGGDKSKARGRAYLLLLLLLLGGELFIVIVVLGIADIVTVNLIVGDELVKIQALDLAWLNVGHRSAFALGVTGGRADYRRHDEMEVQLMVRFRVVLMKEKRAWVVEGLPA